jgi:DNA repair photolyase
MILNNGITTSVFFGPIYSTISIDDIPSIIDRFIESDVSKIWIDSLNLKPGIWENVKQNILDNKEMYTVFSKNMSEDKDYYKKLRDEIFRIGKERNIKIVDAF